MALPSTPDTQTLAAISAMQELIAKNPDFNVENVDSWKDEVAAAAIAVANALIAAG